MESWSRRGVLEKYLRSIVCSVVWLAEVRTTVWISVAEEDKVEDGELQDFDPSLIKKKKKKKKKEATETTPATKDEHEAGGVSWDGSERDYTYAEVSNPL